MQYNYTQLTCKLDSSKNDITINYLHTDPCTGTMTSGSYMVEWKTEEDSDYVKFKYSADTTNWVGLGFSLTANMVCKSTKYNYTNLIIVLIIIFVLTIAKL